VSLGVALGFAFWIPQLTGQAVRTNRSWRSPIDLGGVRDQTSTALCSTFASFSPPDPVVGWTGVVVLLAVFAYLAARRTWASGFLVATSLVPVALLLAYTLLTGNNIYHARYLTFVQISWLAAIAFMVGTLGVVERTVLVGQLAAVAAWCCFNDWGILGPSANPGMRGAAAFVAQYRELDEPVVALTPFVFHKAGYYVREGPPPLLCVRKEGRLMPHQKAEDLTTADRLLGDPELRGVWLISSRSYNANLVIQLPIPANWRRVHHEEFAQDYPRELPILVEHYRVEPKSAAMPE
jgi:hypothetical protein